MKQVSVIMPMRNAQDYVQAALESLLRQQDVDLEIVVVDDGSTDRSAAVVQGLNDARIRLIRGPGQGISVALNHALEAAAGQYIAKCDADDVYSPDRLKKQVRYLAQNKDFGAICGSFSTMNRKGRHISDLDCGPAAKEITDELRAGTVRTSLGTYLVRAAAYQTLGGFRSYFVTAEDIDMQLRLCEITRVWYDPAPTYAYRLHDDSITHVQSDATKTFYDRIAREFQIQRKSGLDDLQRNCPPPPPEPGASAATSADDQIQNMLIGSSWNQHRAGEKKKAIGTGLQAVRNRPASVAAWRNLLALAMKRSGDNRS
jgi:glycosyltransferase involved in cell wall biosynthesis